MIAQLDHVTKRYGQKVAVRDLSIDIGAGDVVCLLGPNGAGKTTTLKMILGLERPSDGVVRVCGVDVAADPAAARGHMAYIPEMVSLHEAFTGRENIAYFSALVRGSKVSQETLDHCLDRAGLQRDAFDQRVSGYSKGMRQKVGVAIALAKGADLLVLDEPTSGLDPKSAYDFAKLINSVAGAGAGGIMATHDLFRAKDMGTHIIILKDGVAVQQMDPKTSSYADIEAAYLAVFDSAA